MQRVVISEGGIEIPVDDYVRTFLNMQDIVIKCKDILGEHQPSPFWVNSVEDVEELGKLGILDVRSVENVE